MGKVQHAAAVAGRVFHARVVAELGEVMRGRGLRLLSGGPGDVATLTSRQCWVKLVVDADGAVACMLIDPRKGAAFELMLYLQLMVRERVTRFLPAVCGCEDVTDAWLGSVAAALGARALDGPLGGDFSWARDYWLLYEEAFTVGEELVPVLRRGGGDLREWRRMVGSGDPCWIDEGRKAIELRIESGGVHCWVAGLW